MHPVAKFLGAWSAAGLLALLGARVGLALAPPVRESWTLYQVGTDTSVLLVRMGVGSTGFYRNQLTTRLARIEQLGGVTEHRATWGPTVLHDDGVASGPDRLESGPQGWRMRVGGEGVQASGTLTGFEPGCPPEPGRFVGAIGLSGTDSMGPTGSLASAGGTLLEGPAVLVRGRGAGNVAGNALYVLGVEVAIGVDPLAECPAWARVRGQTWSGEAPEVPSVPGTVEVGPWTIRFTQASPALVVEAWGAIPKAEQWLARLVGFAPPRQSLRRVAIRIEGPGIEDVRTGLWLGRSTMR